MKLIAEVSMYPLKDSYLTPIDRFLDRLRHPDVEVKTNRMSTQLYGEHDAVMDLLKSATKAAAADGDEAAYVIKLIPGRRAHHQRL